MISLLFGGHFFLAQSGQIPLSPVFAHEESGEFEVTGDVFFYFFDGLLDWIDSKHANFFLLFKVDKCAWDVFN